MTRLISLYTLQPMLAKLCIIFSIATFTTCMTSITADYAPVDKLDLTKYVGRWYQVYKNRFDNTFQGGGTCAVADYQLVDTAVTVSNNQINKDGSLGQIKGSAFYSPGNTGGELTVSLDGVPREAPYWVIEIGPVKDNQYEYSIVSDNNRFSLFVLARNVTQYYEEYDEMVQASLKSYGFTNALNKPITLSQEDCDYSRYDTDTSSV